MIETIRQGLKADGIHVSISKLCQWFAVPRRTVYYHPTKAVPKVDANQSSPDRCWPVPAACEPESGLPPPAPFTPPASRPS